MIVSRSTYNITSEFFIHSQIHVSQRIVSRIVRNFDLPYDVPCSPIYLSRWRILFWRVLGTLNSRNLRETNAGISRISSVGGSRKTCGAIMSVCTQTSYVFLLSCPMFLFLPSTRANYTSRLEG